MDVSLFRAARSGHDQKTPLTYPEQDNEKGLDKRRPHGGLQHKNEKRHDRDRNQEGGDNRNYREKPVLCRPLHGICNSLFDSGIDVVKVSQTRNLNRYVFRKDRNRKFRIRSKGKKTYDRLNCLKPVKGFTLHEALERKIFQLRGNRIYFRGGSVYTVESTLFHLVGEKKILADRIPEISYNFFRRVIDSKTTVTRKLGLIKILLQTMGWGVVKILERKKKIIFEIRNPPFGLQMERDNWIFLVNAVLGYLWILDKGFKLESAKHQGKLLEVVYSKP